MNSFYPHVFLAELSRTELELRAAVCQKLGRHNAMKDVLWKVDATHKMSKESHTDATKSLMVDVFLQSENLTVCFYSDNIKDALFW